MSSLSNHVEHEEEHKELETAEVRKMSSGPDLDFRNFPCRRPANTNSKVYQFQRYLELTGVTKALSQALGSLCCEKPKPADPMKYIVDKMCEAGQVAKWSEGAISLRNELSQLRTMVMYAETENERFRGFLKRSKVLEEVQGEDEEEEEEEFVDEEEEEELPPLPPSRTRMSRTSVNSRVSKTSLTST